MTRTGAGLTCLVRPEALDADDVGLVVGLGGRDVHKVAHAVRAVLEAAVLAVGALRARLPRLRRQLSGFIRVCGGGEGRRAT